MPKSVSWGFFLSLFRAFLKQGGRLDSPGIGPMLRKLAELEPDALTQGYTLNLNASLADAAQGVVLPVELMQRAIRESECRVIMKRCLCRVAFSCDHYPKDHGCLFLGERARGLVEKGIGREAGVEEALAHVDKAAELGLVGQALWVEVERLLMGLGREKGTARWLEFCFCCPCCCGVFRLSRAAARGDIKGRFRSIGWKAVIDQGTCIRCMACVRQCPVDAAVLEGERVEIRERDCLGCGICAARCPKKAITLRLAAPVKGSIREYFTDGGLNVDL